MTTIFAQKALLPTGWADNVRLSVDAGRIQSISCEVHPDDGDVLAECLIPGLCNSHSHAFQRALAGRTEERSPAGQDSFWTWRERMYELAGRLDADLNGRFEKPEPEFNLFVVGRNFDLGNLLGKTEFCHR